MYKFGKDTDIFTFRVLVLSNAVRTINGKALDDFKIGGEFETPYHKRMSIIDHLQMSVVEDLYKEYETMSNKAQGIDEEEVKK